MKWIKNFSFFAKNNNPAGGISKSGASWYPMADKYQNGIPNAKEIANIRCLQPQRVSETWLQQDSLVMGDINLRERLILVRNVIWRFELPFSFKGSPPRRSKQIAMNISRQFGRTVQNDPCLSRDFLVQLWLADKIAKNSRGKRRRRVDQHVQSSGTASKNQLSFQHPFAKWFSGVLDAKERSNDEVKPVLKQPPLSQSAIGLLKPGSPEEAKVATLLSRSNLLITRNIEWANLVLGFEQENQYAIVDACYPQSPAGFIREQSNVIFRQLLRSRRPFIAYITDAMGNELFRVRRPFWWITSTIYAEIDGKEIGVVHRRWHLWRRVYDLYLGKKQFAVVENPGLWNWTFTLKDIDGNVLAEISRDWRGFGFELLTDAGQYVIRFGHADSSSKTGPATAIQDLDITRPLTLSERAVAVALAVSLDNDYFSRHGGWGLPFIAVEE